MRSTGRLPDLGWSIVSALVSALALVLVASVSIVGDDSTSTPVSDSVAEVLGDSESLETEDEDAAGHLLATATGRRLFGGATPPDAPSRPEGPQARRNQSRAPPPFEPPLLARV